jgi:Carboxypeptidase regulatory-like domain
MLASLVEHPDSTTFISRGENVRITTRLGAALRGNQLRAAIRGSLIAATAAGLLASLALAAPAQAANGPSGASAKLPLSPAQMRADRRLHNTSQNPTTTVTGIVRTAAGAPLASVCVTAYGPSGTTKSAVTGANGRYSISGLRAGRYQFAYRSCAGSAAAYLPEWYGNVLQRAVSRSVILDSSSLKPIQSLAAETLYPADSNLGDLPSVVPQHGSDVVASDPFGSHRAVPTSAAAVVRSAFAAARQRAHLTSATASASAKKGIGTISGRVTSRSGQGLAGMCVEAAPLTSFRIYNTKTGADGRYSMKVPAGPYEMAFYTGCGNYGNWLIQLWKNDYSETKQPTTVKVEKGHTTTIKPVMKLGGEISGTVRGPSGKKLSGICVSPLLVTGSDYFYFGAVAHNGVYHARGLPAGTYQMGFSPCRNTKYAPTLWPDTQSYRAAAVLTVQPPKEINNIDEVMQPGGVISGTVTSATTPPTALAGMCVFVEENSGLYDFGNASTNASGNYRITGLPAGPYSVIAFPGCEENSNYVQGNYPKQIKVYNGATDSHINVALPVGDIVSGTVTSAATGKPIKGICVAVFQTNGYIGDEVRSSASGTYKVNQLPAGRYEVQFIGGCGNTGSYAPQGYDNTNVFDPQILKFAGAGLTLASIDAAMQPGPVIKGTVRSTSGQLLSGICVEAVTPAGAGFDLAITKHGSYSMPNLAPGQYQVVFGPGCGNNQNLLTEWYPSQVNPTATVSASSGTVTGIDAHLPPAGGVAGVVRTASGKQVQLSCIILTGLTGKAKGLVGEILVFGAQYEVTGVPTGTWQVAFAPTCLGLNYATQYYKDKPSPAGATHIKVRPLRTVKGLDSKLVAGGTISGRLTSAGKPATQMCLYAQNVSVDDDFGGGFTNSKGYYTIDGLNSGRYEIEAYPCGTASENLATVILPRIVHVSAPHNTGRVNGRIQLGGTMTGQVLGGSPTTGQANICVEAIQTNGIGYGAFLTNRSGKYSITGLTPGYYKVYVGDPFCTYGDQDLAPLWFPDSATQADGKLLAVTSGGTVALPPVTMVDDGSISGTVTQKSGAGLRGVCVAATGPAAGTPVYAVTGSGGNYSIIDLPAGSYRVRFSSGCGATGYKTQWWKDASSAKAATVVTVTSGAVTANIGAALAK